MLKLPFTWEAMEPLITELENYEWNSLGDFENWLEKKIQLRSLYRRTSQLESNTYIQRYIKRRLYPSLSLF